MSYIMLFKKFGLAFLAGGENPCDAVEQYYNDMYRVAKIPGNSVIVFGLPPSFDDTAYERLADMASEALAAEVPKLLSQYPDITATTVNVVYGSDNTVRAKATAEEGCELTNALPNAVG